MVALRNEDACKPNSELLKKVSCIGVDLTLNLKDVDKDITEYMMGVWNAISEDINNIETVKGVLQSLLQLKVIEDTDKMVDNKFYIELEKDKLNTTNNYSTTSPKKKMKKGNEVQGNVNNEQHNNNFNINTSMLQYSKFHQSIMLIYAINTYYKNLHHLNHQKDIICMLQSIACNVLDNLIQPFRSYNHGFLKIIDHHILVKRFYIFLKNSFLSPTEYQTMKLYEFYSHYLNTQKENIQNFLQVFCCKSLFKKGKFDLIYELITRYKIHNIDGVDRLELQKIDIFKHYYILGKSSIKSNDWKLAYQLFQIMLSIKGISCSILINELNIAWILNEYVVILMKLGVNWRDKDTFFYLYYDLISPYLVSCYMSYSKLNYSDFIFRYLTFSITTLPADPYDEVILNDENLISAQKTIFTELLLKELCEQLLKTKWNSLKTNIRDDKLVTRLIGSQSCEEINRALNRLNINVNMKNVIVTNDLATIETDELLMKLQALSQTNSKLKVVLNDIQMLRESRKDFD